MPLTPVRARQLLRTTGSPQQDAPGRPASQRIGNRPNLRQLVQALSPKKLEKREKIEKDIRKELKREKLEQKELKREKLEKLEKVEKDVRKEVKLEKLEQKELKEGKIEIKERKPEIEKRLEKQTDKIQEVFGGGAGGAEAYSAEAGLAARVEALEGAVQELAHFISSELRPDLQEGALMEEYDLEAYEGLDPGQ
jgi:hypothetical protein